MSKEAANSIEACFISPNVPDSNLEPANVVDVIAGAGLNISRALDRLGNADASTPLGAIENLAMEMKHGLGAVADSICELASAIREHG